MHRRRDEVDHAPAATPGRPGVMREMETTAMKRGGHPSGRTHSS